MQSIGSLSTIFPSVVRPPNAPTLLVPKAVVKGGLRIFNHHDDKWVLGFDDCRLHTSNGTTQVNGLTLLLLRRGGGRRAPRYGCLRGPEGSSPYVLSSFDSPNAGTGFYTKCRAKQRRFRIEANDAFVVVGGAALRLESLYVEADYR